MRLLFVRPVFQSFLIAISSHLAMGWKKGQGTPARKNRRATTDSRRRKKPTPAL
jgi:hypothetical protein